MVSVKTDLIPGYSGVIVTDEPLKNHTSYKIGGKAKYYTFPENVKDLISVLEYAANSEIPFFIIGGGSNLLFSDKGFPGVVIDLTRHFKKIEISDEKIVTEAGARLSNLVRACADNSLSGFEELTGVPGTVAGAVVMNAGAFGSEISRNLTEISVLNHKLNLSSVKRDNLNFEYRKSSLPEGWIILSCTFEAITGIPSEEIKEKGRRFLDRRKSTQPLDCYSAGSVFKNPEHAPPAGKLIDMAGLKGLRVGGAEVSGKHGNFIINRGDATAQDVLKIIDIVREKVFRDFRVSLELEIKLVGFDVGI